MSDAYDEAIEHSESAPLKSARQDAPVCVHRVTLETDYARAREVIVCVLCGKRAELSFAELAAELPGDDQVLRRAVAEAFGVRLPLLP